MFKMVKIERGYINRDKIVHITEREDNGKIFTEVCYESHGTTSYIHTEEPMITLVNRINQD